MLVIRALHGSRPAFADYFLNRPECSLLAGQIHGNIKSTNLRVVRHRSPALESGRAWAHIQFDSQLRNLAWKVSDFPGLRIHLNNRLVTEIRRVDELAVGSIELPEDPELTHFEERLPSTDIHKNVFENFVHILRFAGKVLVIPLHFAVIRIERERRVRVERIAIGSTGDSSPRLGLCCGPINEVGFRIVAAWNPRIAARAKCQWQIAPCVTARFAWPRDRGSAPDFL